LVARLLAAVVHVSGHVLLFRRVSNRWRRRN
jgi:hypothetical protein